MAGAWDGAGHIVSPVRKHGVMDEAGSHDSHLSLFSSPTFRVNSPILNPGESLVPFVE